MYIYIIYTFIRIYYTLTATIKFPKVTQIDSMPILPRLCMLQLDTSSQSTTNSLDFCRLLLVSNSPTFPMAWQRCQSYFNDKCGTC